MIKETNKNYIETAIAGNSNYLMPAAVMLKSLFENNKNSIITINFLYLKAETDESDVTLLEKYIISHGHLFRPLIVTDKILGEVPECRHGKSSFLRLLLPGLMPKNIDKVLYLDCDIIVNGSIAELFNTDITSYYIAAVKDSTSIRNPEHIKNLNLPDNYFYFNSGILLFNLINLRKDNIQKLFFKNLKNINNKIKAFDQDVLNVTLYSKVKYIPPKYNLNFFIEKDILSRLFTKQEIKETFKNPVIVHFIGKVKPWHYISFHPKTKLWRKYLKLTPYADSFKFHDKNIKNFFRKYFFMYFKKFELFFKLKHKKFMVKLLPEKLKKILLP